MVDLEEVRRMAQALPEARAGYNDNCQFFAEVAGKGFAWTWMERIVNATLVRLKAGELLRVDLDGAHRAQKAEGALPRGARDTRQEPG